MGGCRYGHVVRKFHRVIPIEVPIHNGRSKPGCAIFPRILVDSFNSFEKPLSIAKQRAIMVVTMQVYFASTRTEEIQKSLGDLIAFFGNNLKRGFDSKRIINLH